MKWVRRCILFLAVVVLVLAIILWFHDAQHWVAVHTGTENAGPDKFYNWWSGFGSDLGEAALVSVIVTPAIVAYRHHECHVGPCHRLAHHTTKDGYKLCKRCVAKPLAALELHEIHSDHQ